MDSPHARGMTGVGAGNDRGGMDFRVRPPPGLTLRGGGIYGAGMAEHLYASIVFQSLYMASTTPSIWV